MSCAKTAEPIEMQFGMLSRVEPGNHVLDEGLDALMARGNFEGEGHAPTCPTTLCSELCKTAESIELPFRLWTRVGPKEACVTCGYIGAT